MGVFPKAIALTTKSHFHVKRTYASIRGLVVRTIMSGKTRISAIEECYFHFNQSLWRHVKELGLTRAYRNNEHVKKVIRKVMSIDFLPTAIVRNNFVLLHTENRTWRLFRRYPGLVEFFNYVYNNYIDRNFPVTLWNVYDRDMDCHTNNHAKGNCS